MYTVTATQKGQIVIPSKIRKKLHIKKGTKLYIQEDGRQIVVRPATAGYIDSLEGFLEVKENLSEALLKDRKADSIAMERKLKKCLK